MRDTTAADVLIPKSCTLDLNGCVITAGGYNAAFIMEQSCSLTVKDGNPTAKHGGDTPDGGVINGDSFSIRSGASVTLNSGTIGEVSSDSSTSKFIMYGGAVKGDI